MTVTVASFRGAFPEFEDNVVYPDPQVQFWLDLSVNLFNQSRWGNLLDYGTQLFMGHNLCLGAQAAINAVNGGNPGNVEGPVTNGSVDKVSYARNPGLVMDPKNGHWNLTIYGIRYVQLVAMIGAGPVYVGAPSAQDYLPGAWPGPQFYGQ